MNFSTPFNLLFLNRNAFLFPVIPRFGNNIKIYLKSLVQLSENDKNIVFCQVQSIYSTSELDLEVVVVRQVF